MQIVSLRTIQNVEVEFLHVCAEVRYWEDAIVNGVEDGDGSLIPCRTGECWTPSIRLSDGQVGNWPVGVEADIHYKVCDQGEYWLADTNGNRVAKWVGHYVPDDLLCIGDNGYGDYIILKIGVDGRIKGWNQLNIDAEQWAPMPVAA